MPISRKSSRRASRKSVSRESKKSVRVSKRKSARISRKSARKSARKSSRKSRKSARKISKKSRKSSIKSRKNTRKSTKRSTKKISHKSPDKRKWKKITLTISYKPKRVAWTSSHLKTHLKRAGKVIIWDILNKSPLIRSSDLSAVKTTSNKIKFMASFDGLKESYGTTANDEIKKYINSFDPEKSSDFWKPTGKVTLFIKKIKIVNV